MSGEAVAALRDLLARHTDETARTVEDCRRQGCCEDGCEITYCGGCGALVDDEPCKDREAARLALTALSGGDTPATEEQTMSWRFTSAMDTRPPSPDPEKGQPR